MGRTPGLSRVRDGVLVSEIDLNHCRQVRDKWGFQMTQRLREYAQALAAASSPAFQPQVIADTGFEYLAGGSAPQRSMGQHAATPQLAPPVQPPQLTFAGTTTESDD